MLVGHVPICGAAYEGGTDGVFALRDELASEVAMKECHESGVARLDPSWAVALVRRVNSVIPLTDPDVERVGGDSFTLTGKIKIGSVSDGRAYLVTFSVAGHCSRLSVIALLVASRKPPPGTGAARDLMIIGLQGMPPPRKHRFWIPDQGELNDICGCHGQCFFCLVDGDTVRDPDRNDPDTIKIERDVHDWPAVAVILELLQNADTRDITRVVPAFRHWLAILLSQMAKSQWNVSDDMPSFIRRMPNASNVNFGAEGKYGDVHEQRSGLSLNTLAAATSVDHRDEFVGLWSKEPRPVPWARDRTVSWAAAAESLVALRWSARSAPDILRHSKVIVETALTMDPAAWTKGCHVGLHIPGIMTKHGIADVNLLIEENIEMANQIFDADCDWLNADGVRALQTSVLPHQLAAAGYIDVAVKTVGKPPHDVVVLGPRRPEPARH